MTKGAKKWFSGMLTLLLFSSLLAACGGGGSSDSAGSAGTSDSGGTSGSESSGKKVEVTMITWESKEMNDKIMAAMKQFEQENPDITVKLIPTPLDNYGVKVNGMLTAKKAPDIFMTGNDMLLDNASKGLLYDWTSQAEQDKEFMDGFYKGVVDSWHYDGKLVGLPGLLNTYGIFYIKKRSRTPV
ncbi:ABC transporter substrate-binding protein [Paenibacillus sp. AR247]|uniref:ABC transporter substrate-binding protein n=1 Tax=Paenibacillus sp. AR247 TaxID=1631599 RepID=UPI0021589721|nr:extracellular solute-binding protein [Paenibacillus sp. AR247]